MVREAELVLEIDCPAFIIITSTHSIFSFYQTIIPVTFDTCHSEHWSCQVQGDWETCSCNEIGSRAAPPFGTGVLINTSGCSFFMLTARYLVTDVFLVIIGAFQVTAGFKMAQFSPFRHGIKFCNIFCCWLDKWILLAVRAKPEESKALFITWYILFALAWGLSMLLHIWEAVIEIFGAIYFSDYNLPPSFLKWQRMLFYTNVIVELFQLGAMYIWMKKVGPDFQVFPRLSKIEVNYNHEIDYRTMIMKKHNRNAVAEYEQEEHPMLKYWRGARSEKVNEVAIYTHPNGRREKVRVIEKCKGGGYRAYVPSRKCEERILDMRLDFQIAIYSHSDGHEDEVIKDEVIVEKKHKAAENGERKYTVFIPRLNKKEEVRDNQLLWIAFYTNSKGELNIGFVEEKHTETEGGGYTIYIPPQENFEWMDGEKILEEQLSDIATRKDQEGQTVRLLEDQLSQIAIYSDPDDKNKKKEVVLLKKHKCNSRGGRDTYTIYIPSKRAIYRNVGTQQLFQVAKYKGEKFWIKGPIDKNEGLYTIHVPDSGEEKEKRFSEKSKLLPVWKYTKLDGRRENVTVMKNHNAKIDQDGGGHTIYVPSLKRRERIFQTRLDFQSFKYRTPLTLYERTCNCDERTKTKEKSSGRSMKYDIFRGIRQDTKMEYEALDQENDDIHETWMDLSVEAIETYENGDFIIEIDFVDASGRKTLQPSGICHPICRISPHTSNDDVESKMHGSFGRNKIECRRIKDEAKDEVKTWFPFKCFIGMPFRFLKSLRGGLKNVRYSIKLSDLAYSIEKPDIAADILGLHRLDIRQYQVPRSKMESLEQAFDWEVKMARHNLLTLFSKLSLRSLRNSFNKWRKRDHRGFSAPSLNRSTSWNSGPRSDDSIYERPNNFAISLGGQTQQAVDIFGRGLIEIVQTVSTDPQATAPEAGSEKESKLLKLTRYNSSYFLRFRNLNVEHTMLLEVQENIEKLTKKIDTEIKPQMGQFFKKLAEVSAGFENVEKVVNILDDDRSVMQLIRRQQERIHEESYKQNYYTLLQMRLVGACTACSSINSGMVENSGSGGWKADAANTFSEAFSFIVDSSGLPFAGFATGIISGVAKRYNDQKKLERVNNFLKMFPKPGEAEKKAELIARELCLRLDEELRSLNNEDKSRTQGIPTNLMDKLKETMEKVLEAEKARIFENTEVKKRAKKDAETIIEEIMSGKFAEEIKSIPGDASVPSMFLEESRAIVDGSSGSDLPRRDTLHQIDMLCQSIKKYKAPVEIIQEDHEFKTDEETYDDSEAADREFENRVSSRFDEERIMRARQHLEVCVEKYWIKYLACLILYD